MRRLAPPLTSLLLLVATNAVADDRSALVGCYATKPGGVSDIRVLHRGEQYYLAMRSNWKHEVPAREPTPAQVHKLFNEQARFYSTGLYAGMLGLFKVKPGMTINHKPVSGQYVAVIMIGAGEVYRASCP
jgi:hypothetical protein